MIRKIALATGGAVLCLASAALAQDRICPKGSNEPVCEACIAKLKPRLDKIAEMHALYNTLTSKAQAEQKAALKLDIANAQAAYEKSKAKCF